MFPFDLSTINILLIAAVIALFILFVTVLMKLNPSTETKEKLETDEAERKRPSPTSPIAPRNSPSAKIDVQRAADPPLVAVSSTIGKPSVQVKQETPAPTRSQSREIPKPEKNVAPAKTESASSKGDCLHEFGYLRTLPKNAPIPDECFGCPKIIECLIKAKT